MHNAVMGSLDGDLKKIAFDVAQVKRILNRSGANIVHSDNGTLFLELDGCVYPVECSPDNAVKPYFIVLRSSEAFNVSEHRMLFEVRDLPNDLVMGTDIGGQEHLCRKHGPSRPFLASSAAVPGLCLERIEAKLEREDVSSEEFEEIKNMIRNFRNGHFFEELTSEFSSKIKEIAGELIDFRRDIKKRIEPGIVEIASKDIPEASNQLEGINETLEKSTMKIMDINEEQMDLANTQVARLQSILSGNGGDDTANSWDRGRQILREMREIGTRLPEEARQVMDFVVPGMDTGEELMARGGDAAAVQEALSEALVTLEELILDMGAEDETLEKLYELCTELKGLFADTGTGMPTGEERDGESGPHADTLQKAVVEQVEILRAIGGLSLKMMEPLSFQDLVGQRIQRIIRLVKTMEMRIEDLIISFGIKMKKHKENPEMTFEDLDREVAQYKSDLKGPQAEGEGLDQEDIDALLASL